MTLPGHPSAPPAPPRPPRPSEDTVPEERQHDEVDGEHHAALHAPLRLDAVIHDLVPVFARQDLKGTEKHTANPSQPRAPRRRGCGAGTCPGGSSQALVLEGSHPFVVGMRSSRPGF